MTKPRKISTRQAYLVQPFIKSGEVLRQAQWLRLDSEAQALRKGAEMAEGAAGAVVWAMGVCQEVDFCGEPRVLASYGDVPEG